MNENEIKNGHSKDIIYVSSIPWDFSWHRQQEMMSYLAEHGFRVLFVEPCSKKHPFQKLLRQEKENVWRLRPCGLPYERCLKTVNRLNAQLSRTDIRETADRLHFRTPIIWLDRVHGFDFKYFQKNSFVVYDLVDEILAFGRVRNDRMLLDLENQVLRRADILLSSSQMLMERKIKQSGRDGKSLFLPNGVDCARFKGVSKKAPADPKKQVVLGFVGNISKRRINYGLIRSIAEDRPQWKLLFVGPGTEEDKEELRRGIRNIEIRNAVPGAKIPDVIREFDVGIIPYNIEKEDMDYVFPRKACEYLAAGKPVICMPLKEVECLKPYVQVVTDAESFIRKAEEVTDENEIATEARRTFAQKYDWNFLMKGLVAILSQPDESGT